MLGVLIEKLKEKKIDFKRITKISDIANVKNAVVVAISDNSQWKHDVILSCNGLSIPIIIITDGMQQNLGGIYNSVSVDFGETLSMLNSYINEYHKNRIAIYGINQTSDSDLELAERIFTELTFETQGVPVFYDNTENLDKCFWEFFKNRDSYDTVICVNDLVALKFTDMLKEYDKATLDRLFIIAFNNLIMSELHSPSITSFSADDVAFANAIIKVYQSIKSSNDFSRMHIRIKQRLNIRETTHFMPLPKNTPIAVQMSNETISTVLKNSNWLTVNKLVDFSDIEKMFRKCDKRDLVILKQLLEGCPLSEIVDKTFSSMGSVKYRLSKMINNADRETKSELIDLLKANIDMEKFEKFVELR